MIDVSRFDRKVAAELRQVLKLGDDVSDCKILVCTRGTLTRSIAELSVRSREFQFAIGNAMKGPIAKIRGFNVSDKNPFKKS